MSVTDHSQSQEWTSVQTDPHICGGFIPLSIGLEGWWALLTFLTLALPCPLPCVAR